MFASISRVQEVEIKGAALSSRFATIEALLDTSSRDKLLAALPVEAQELFRTHSLSQSAWYPVSWYGALLGVVAAELGAQGLRDISRRSVERDVSTLYRIIFRALSIELALTQVDRLFHVFFRGGKVDVESVTAGRAVLHYRECFGFDANLWATQLAGTEATMGAIGARAPRLRILSGGTGAAAVVEAEWR
jgi:hypothetical protein